MLATYVQVHDIRDAEGFVGATIERSHLRGRITEAEREDLMAEGLCILFELGDRFEVHREGYAQAGRFSGFAAQMLPRRLGDAWHSANPGHQRTTDTDGNRTWTYAPPPISLDGEEAPDVIAPAIADLQADMPGIEAAIATIEPWRQFAIKRMVELVLDGHGWDEVANLLGVSRLQIAQMRERLAIAITEATFCDLIAS